MAAKPIKISLRQTRRRSGAVDTTVMEKNIAQPTVAAEQVPEPGLDQLDA